MVQDLSTNNKLYIQKDDGDFVELKYGNKVEFILFLCGYFDSGYLGFEASEGIDWIWEHRIEDIEKLGI